jgi:hypothetical protein
MKNLSMPAFENPANQPLKAVSNTKGSNNLLKIKFSIFLFVFLITNAVQSQCPVGTQQAILNWDNLDFFVYTGNYTSPNYLTSNALSRTQQFSFGTQRVTIVHDYADADNLGENIAHTGEAGTYGDVNGAATDADIQLRGDGTVTITFENEVSNLRFSMYDIDRSQRVELDARNAANVQQNVTMATFGATILTLTNNGTISARADAAGATNRGNASLDASLDILIAGPVKTITIDISNTNTGGSEDGSFWISDLIACSVGTFPNNYYIVSQPFTGQPGYLLHAFGKSVYAVNPANGVTKLLFTDAAGPGNVNSMGYDPYRRILYYVYSLTGSASTNRRLMKYDFNTETISQVLADVRTIGIPLASSGVESGAAAFYNGNLYLGMETSNSSQNSGREALVWRIDFDASNVPYRASQVFGVQVDNSGTLTHDWADFAISNGMLYDFDGAGGASDVENDVNEFNLLTGASVNFTTLAFTPGQNATGWNENVYQFYASSPTVPYIAPYNKGAGTIGASINLSSTPPFTPAIPSLGDAAEGFRPLMDFGDAPATYDPIGIDPAMHERLTNLRLGNVIDLEWLGTSSALADADGIDEDGLGGTPPLLNYLGTLTYTLNINVFNNTGANATLVSWLDYNFNGVFDAGEGVSVTVPSSAIMQSVPVTWAGISVPNTANTQTFIRFRLAPATDGLTTAKMNGWVANGEVEDHAVLIGVALPNNSLTVQAVKNNNATVTVNWTHQSDILVKHYTIQRSEDGRNWDDIGTVNGGNNSIKKDYAYTDVETLNNNQFYRIQVIYETNRKEYSAILSVNISSNIKAMKLSPNPAVSSTNISVSASGKSDAIVTILDYAGKTVMQSKFVLTKGNNILAIQGLDNLNKGIYVVRLKTNDRTETSKLVISK